jgi:FdrA protein
VSTGATAMASWNFVRKSFYQDSVTLMLLTRDMEAVPGVARAAAMMGTPQNLVLLHDAGLLAAAGEAAGPTDLVIAVLASSGAAAEAARAATERALTARPASGPPGAAPRPRTLAGALRALPGANLALISVPGAYAGAEALKALRAGLHVMLFSDNVPVATEVELKTLARERGLFMMGPDCGTAIVGGVPLGFANAVPRGRIGIAAASGTGLQEVVCHIAAAGEGVSHAIGVGGRDLTDAVGGLMLERALAALASDPATEVVCVIGKPPGPATRARLGDWLGRLGKPCVVNFVTRAARPAGGGSTPPPAATHVAATLEDAALAAVALARGKTPAPVEFTDPPGAITRLVEDAERRMRAGQRFVRGVYSGGTLAYEALGLLEARLADVAPGLTGGGVAHRVVDLGEDVFTVGRPHPMIDGTVRREWIEKEGAAADTAVLLLDVVLGYGTHADPAGELLPAIVRTRRAAESAGRHLAVVASVCGTDGDPQGRSAQAAALRGAGVVVMPSNAQAARLAALIAARRA